MRIAARAWHRQRLQLRGLERHLVIGAIGVPALCAAPVDCVIEAAVGIKIIHAQYGQLGIVRTSLGVVDSVFIHLPNAVSAMSFPTLLRSSVGGVWCLVCDRTSISSRPLIQSNNIEIISYFIKITSLFLNVKINSKLYLFNGNLLYSNGFQPPIFNFLFMG